VDYTIAVSASPSAGNTVTGGGTFVSGSPTPVTATTTGGYTFTNWTVNGSVVSSADNYSFTLTTNINLVANFVSNTVGYTIAVSASPSAGGTVAGGGTFVSGSTNTVTATTNGGYTFTNWTVNGSVVSSANDYSFTLTTNINLAANFVKNSTIYKITSNAGKHGSINPNGLQTVTTGSTVTVTAAATNGYQVNQWLVNGEVAQTGSPVFTLRNVNTNYAVTVTFSPTGVTPTTVVTDTNIDFAILVSGNGELAPVSTINALQAGKKYTLTAVAAKGSVFADWVSNGIVVADTPKYTFSVESNVVLQANFIPNPFIPVMGTYHGLFYVPENAAEESSGYFVGIVNSVGGFSTRLYLGGQSYVYSGDFSVTGLAQKIITRSGLSPLTVQLQLGLTNGPMTGTVSDGTWVADLVANPSVYSTTNPAPQAGKYTLVIPGSEDAATQPGGNGFGAVTVSDLGAVTFSGMLGDGTAVTSASVVSSDGQWPFYVSLYGGKGSMIGWLSFTNEGAISGQVGWFKLPEATAKLYPGGFTNSPEIAGSVYHYTNNLPMLGFTNGLLLLTNGNFQESITNQILVSADKQEIDKTGDTLAFNTLSGLFKGSVINPETGKPVTVNGVVLQNQNIGAGLFLGTNESGSVVLSQAE
jgi:hypothetical protein